MASHSSGCRQNTSKPLPADTQLRRLNPDNRPPTRATDGCADSAAARQSVRNESSNSPPPASRLLSAGMSSGTLSPTLRIAESQHSQTHSPCQANHVRSSQIQRKTQKTLHISRFSRPVARIQLLPKHHICCPNTPPKHQQTSTTTAAPATRATDVPTIGNSDNTTVDNMSLHFVNSSHDRLTLFDHNFNRTESAVC